MRYIVFALSIIWVSGAHAQTNRYVAAGGTDTGGCSNPVQPCGSPHYAANQMESGDTLRISGYHLYPNGASPECVAGHVTGSDTLRTTYMHWEGRERALMDGLNHEIVGTWTNTTGEIWEIAWQAEWTYPALAQVPRNRLDSGDFRDMQHHRHQIVVLPDSMPYRYWGPYTPGSTGPPTDMSRGHMAVASESPYHIPGDPVGTGGPTTLYVRLRDGSNPNDSIIKLALSGGGLCVDSGGGQQLNTPFVHVKGLRFVYGNTTAGLVGSQGGSHWIIEDNHVNWSNATGVRIANSDHHIVRNNVVVNSGRGDIMAATVDYVLIEGNFTMNGNWKNYWCGRNCGNKMGPRWSTIRDNHFGETVYADGLWLDVRGMNNRIYRNRIDGATRYGMFIEYNSNRNIIVNNVISRVAVRPEPPSNSVTSQAHGIGVPESKRNIIAHNTIYASGGCFATPGRNPRAVDTGDPFSDSCPVDSYLCRAWVRSNLFINNVCVSDETRHALPRLIWVNHRSNNNATTVAEFEVLGHHWDSWNAVKTQLNWTNAYDGNLYSFREGLDRAFLRREGEGAGSTAWFTLDRIDQWRQPFQTTFADSTLRWPGNDANSIVVDFSQPIMRDYDDYVDGWHLVANSAAIGAGVAIPDTSWWDPNDSIFALDFFGNSRPTAGGADIGAHQFSSPATDPIDSPAVFEPRMFGDATGSAREITPNVWEITATGVGHRSAPDEGFGVFRSLEGEDVIEWVVHEIEADRGVPFGPVAWCLRETEDTDSQLLCLDILTSSREDVADVRLGRLTERSGGSRFSRNAPGSLMSMVRLPVRLRLVHVSGSTWVAETWNGETWEPILGIGTIEHPTEHGPFVARGFAGSGSVRAIIEFIPQE